jgi:hypothetical protein
MINSRASTSPPYWRFRPVVAVLVLVAAGLVGCSKTTPPSPGADDTQASTASSSTPPPAANGSDFCALAIRIATESGIMVNKHYISPQQETLDQFKALVNASLAARDQLVTGLPDDVRAAMMVELEYFQALKDSDFSGTTQPPAGFAAANKTVNDYQVSACGVTFDK